MDRRQRKSRESIFNAFCDLLSKKHYSKITVGEIILRADVGRATFYAHFETKELLLKALAEELFCHIFDAVNGENHRHIFECKAPPSVLLHLLEHLENNDRNIRKLLICENNELFLRYFKENLIILIKSQESPLLEEKPRGVPFDFWINHICTTFVETVRWWMESGMQASAMEIYSCFRAIITPKCQ